MKYIGIVIAMDEEREEILELMTNVQVKQIYNLRFLTGKINNRDCILIKSGVGKVNAARTTQVLLDNFEVEFVINAGAAGAVNYLLNIGDIVIAKHVVQHDFDITAFGHSKGYITGIGDKIQCDLGLVSAFENMLKNMPELSYNIKLGIVASGDIFCTSIDMKNKINSKFNADVVDMECAAVGQVCYLDDIPFISIRCISDVPDGQNEKTFDDNLKLASKRCAKLIYDFCK
mgnify:FL=1